MPEAKTPTCVMSCPDETLCGNVAIILCEKCGGLFCEHCAVKGVESEDRAPQNLCVKCIDEEEE